MLITPINNQNYNNNFMKIYTGLDFNNAFSNKKFYKVTNIDETHYGLTYKTGLNVDTKNFTTDGCKNGLYFTDKANLLNWIDKKLGGNNKVATFLREVVILDDSIVLIENAKMGKYKTNKFILKEACNIFDSDVWNDIDLCIAAIKKNKKYLQLIKNNSDEYYLKLEKLGFQECNVSYYKNKPFETKLNFLQKNPTKFNELEDYTEEMCDAAVKILGSNIQYVNDQTEKQCWFALQYDPKNIKYLKQPTVEMITYAVQHNSTIFDSLDDIYKSPKLIKLKYYFDEYKKIDYPKIDEQDNHELYAVTQHATYLLAKIEETCEKINKKMLSFELFNYLMRNLEIIKSYTYFRNTLIEKLKEFKRSDDFLDWEVDYYLEKIDLCMS